MLRLSLALVAIMGLTPAYAQAPPQPNPQMQGQRGHLREVCAADLQTFCASAGDDRHARRQCMEDNHAKFSKPCQDALSEMQARRARHDADHPRDDNDQGPQ